LQLSVAVNLNVPANGGQRANRQSAELAVRLNVEEVANGRKLAERGNGREIYVVVNLEIAAHRHQVTEARKAREKAIGLNVDVAVHRHQIGQIIEIAQ